MVDAAQFYMNRVLKDYKGKWVIQFFFSLSISVGFIIDELSTVQSNEAPSKFYKPLDPFQLHCEAKAIVLQQIISYWHLEIEMWYRQSTVSLKNRPFTCIILLSEAQKQHCSKSRENSRTQFPARLIACPSILSHNYYYYYYYYYNLLLLFIIQTGVLDREITTKKNCISTHDELW